MRAGIRLKLNFELKFVIQNETKRSGVWNLCLLFYKSLDSSEMTNVGFKITLKKALTPLSLTSLQIQCLVLEVSG